VVNCIDKDSSQLAEALMEGGKIIITTLQKFPFVIDKVGELPNRKYAVIVDEAHSSQTGSASSKMKGILGADIVVDEDDEYAGIEQLIMQSARSRAKQSNLSFFAFTATPKTKTLEMFGQLGADGKPHPFHLYSMRQAIEERFILDVLKNYTTYDMYCNIEKAIVDDPLLNKKKAIRAIARWVTLHPHNIAQKTEIIIEHFRQHIHQKLEGKAKAMVVTSSRKAAVRYKIAFDKLLKDKCYNDIKTLVAFSGSVSDEGIEYVEPKMNKLKNEEELPEKFGTNEYQVLIVAEKYQTGFDQPLLVAMYVDRKLKGLQAVQTLSRLNRSYAGKETFILDFMNDAEDIKTAFKPYYEQTELTETTDPALLYTAKNLLDGFHVFTWEEIDLFSKVFFKPLPEQKEADKGKMHSILDLAVKQFKELPNDEQREEFRHILYGFLRLYSFLSQIVNFQDVELEKLYAYGRFLANKLPRRITDKVNINNEVELDKYRINKTFEGTLELNAGETEKLKSQTTIGLGGDEGESVPLSQIINQLNEKFGADLLPEDRVYFEQIVVDMGADKKLEEQALVNSLDQFRYGFEKKITATLIDRMERNEKISSLFLNNPDMRSYISDEIMKEVYWGFRQQSPINISPNV
jgi:type I restriction enzyme R subunit